MKTVVIICVLLCDALFGFAREAGQADIRSFLKRIEAAYSAVANYRVNVKVRVYRPDGKIETEKFLYTFQKKPKRIRMDFEEPHHGMVIVYPAKDGKVLVEPFSWAKFIKLHLSPDSSLLGNSAQQPIERTDMGTLIRNMARSLTGQRRGQVRIETKGGQIEIGVLADDHFRKGVRTRYLFIIDKTTWLPAGVKEWTANNIPLRSISFRNLQTNIDIPQGFFILNG